MKKILLVFLFLMGWFVNAQAVRALGTTGTGKYKDRIWWLTWDDLGTNGLGEGQTATRTFMVGNVSVTVIIDQIDFTGGSSPGPLSDTRLVGYEPGTWSGDGLDNLYNGGGLGTANNIIMGLSTNQFGAGAANPLLANFRIRAYATIGGLPMDLSLVFSTAEDDSPAEYTQVSTNGSAWQLLESRIIGTGLRRIDFSNNNTTARMQMSASSTTQSTGSNVAILYSTRQLTSATNPFTSNAQFSGGGRAAMALGIMVNSDFGDAPNTYGNAANIFQPVVTGGNPSATTGTFTNYLSTGTNGGSPIITAGTLDNPTFPRLGNNAADTDNVLLHTANAQGDDVSSSTDDEDAFATQPGDANLVASSYSVTLPVFKNTSPATSPRYVAGWIDFNRNG